MNLSELFPENPKIVIGAKEYALKFNTRARLELDRIYPSPEEIGANIKQIISGGMRITDMINFLQAALIGAKNPVERDVLIDEIDPADYSSVIDAIFAAWMRSTATAEQIEQMEVLAAQVKKTEAESGTMPVSTHSTESSADLAATNT